MKEIKGHTNEKIPCVHKLEILLFKITTHLKPIYRVNAFPIKNPMICFTDRKTILKFV